MSKKQDVDLRAVELPLVDLTKGSVKDEALRRRTELHIRVGTFKEDIFSNADEDYEFDVILYYDNSTSPIRYYYDNIDYKYKNTMETLARHIISGNAEPTLLFILSKMKDDECIYLTGLPITHPLCNKAELTKYIKELIKELEV